MNIKSTQETRRFIRRTAINIY